MAAGEVEQTFPAGFLLANKQNGSSGLGNGDSSDGGISVEKGEKFELLPSPREELFLIMLQQNLIQ